jgi:hypothetical protein
VGPRVGLDILRRDKFLAFAGVQTSDPPACRLVAIQTVPCQLHSVPHQTEFGHEMYSGNECGHKLGFILDDKQAL